MSHAAVHSLDSIVVLVPFLFSGLPLGVTIRHVAKGTCKDHEDEDEDEDRWHTAFLY